MKIHTISNAVWSSIIAFLCVLIFVTVPQKPNDAVNTVMQRENVLPEVSVVDDSDVHIAVEHTNLVLSAEVIAAGENIFSNLEDVEKIESIPEQTGGRYIECPFTESENRTIVDFTNKGTLAPENLTIQADGVLENAELDFQKVHIQPGLYSIQLATYRAIDASSKNSFEESWLVRLYTGDEKEILTTKPTRDMRDDEEKTIELVESEALFTETGELLKAEHGAYPNEKAQSISPLCVAFDALVVPAVSDTSTPLVSSDTDTGAITTKTSVVIHAPEKQNSDAVNLDGRDTEESLFSITKVASIHTDADSRVLIEGVTQPHSSATLYIYPKEVAITQIADSDGKLEFMLKDDFADGRYALYLASSSDVGNILAKSNPVYFVKKGEKVEYPVTLASAINKPTFTFKTSIAFGLLLLLIFSILFLLQFGHPVRTTTVSA